MRNVAIAQEEISSQRLVAGRNTAGEGKEGRSKRCGKWRTKMATKKEMWVSRAKQMMQQNVLRRHSLGNQI